MLIIITFTIGLLCVIFWNMVFVRGPHPDYETQGVIGIVFAIILLIALGFAINSGIDDATFSEKRYALKYEACQQNAARGYNVFKQRDIDRFNKSILIAKKFNHNAFIGIFYSDARANGKIVRIDWDTSKASEQAPSRPKVEKSLVKNKERHVTRN